MSVVQCDCRGVDPRGDVGGGDEGGEPVPPAGGRPGPAQPAAAAAGRAGEVRLGGQSWTDAASRAY